MLRFLVDVFWVSLAFSWLTLLTAAMPAARAAMAEAGKE